MRRAISKLADLALWATAAVGVAAIVAATAMAVTGSRPVVVTSGSMEPAIATGSLAVVRSVPASSVEAGDVVAIELPSGKHVLHRVVERSLTPAGVTVITKGDANETPDSEAVVLAGSARRLVAHAPMVGRAAPVMRSPLAGFAAAALLLGPLAARRHPAPAVAPA